MVVRKAKSLTSRCSRTSWERAFRRPASLCRCRDGPGSRRRNTLRGRRCGHLFSFCRPFHRERRRGSARDDLAYLIEIFRANEGLVFDRAIPLFPGSEFFVLQLRVRRHPPVFVILREPEHGEIQRVETRERDELKAVAHAREFGLEACDRRRAQLFPPVERGGTVVSEDLPWESGVDRIGEGTGLFEIRPGRLAPEHVRVRCIRETASDRRGESALDSEESFGGPVSCEERTVPWIGIARYQTGAVRIRPRDDQRRHTHDVRRKAGRDQFLDELSRGNDDLSPQVAALLRGRELVLEVHSGRAGLDHRLRDLERMERTTEPGLRIGHDRCEPVHVVLAGHVLLLILATECVVDPTHDVRDAVGWIQAQIGVHVTRIIPVRRDLPSAQVDRAESGADLLDRLVPGEGPEGLDVVFGPKEFPEPFGPKFRKRVPDPNRASQPFHVRSTIRPQDARPAFRGPPFLFQFHGLSRHAFPLPSFHCESPAYEGSRTQLSSSASRSGVSWTMKPPGGSAPVRFASGLFVESWKESDEDRATGDRTARFLSARTGHSGHPLETSRPE